MSEDSRLFRSGDRVVAIFRDDSVMAEVIQDQKNPYHRVQVMFRRRGEVRVLALRGNDLTLIPSEGGDNEDRRYESG